MQLTRRIEGKDKVPYGEMAENGVIEYEGVVFVCDYDHNRLTLGILRMKNCINIPLSGGGSLLVNRDNIDAPVQGHRHVQSGGCEADPGGTGKGITRSDR